MTKVDYKGDGRSSRSAREQQNWLGVGGGDVMRTSE